MDIPSLSYLLLSDRKIIKRIRALDYLNREGAIKL